MAASEIFGLGCGIITSGGHDGDVTDLDETSAGVFAASSESSRLGLTIAGSILIRFGSGGPESSWPLPLVDKLPLLAVLGDFDVDVCIGRFI